MLFQKLLKWRKRKEKTKIRNSYDNNVVENIEKRNKDDKKKVNTCADFFGRYL
ncbi:hypothetical protein RV15_GL000590 [Enterococcus silesiacus]|uniref:Uncharacterized protein n=1 Tax=Enterococcus silesiacus TaxID=332949 RepID=A0AA91JNZ5_9ENTE|nr:hypothetical protein RV15_GL000590 [Enterococcus silesiacus]